MSGDRALEPAVAELKAKRGQAYWRSLDEFVGKPEVREAIARNFPSLARDGVIRRDMLKILGGAIALAGLDGCERLPDEEALPYVEQPDGETTGVARYYATIVEHDGIAQPAVGKTREGRPIKLEGNERHPASEGASDPFTQAALLNLYDPERSKQPLEGGSPGGWSGWNTRIDRLRERLDASGGQGFRLLTGPIGSPTLRSQVEKLLAQWPQAHWHEHRPLPDGGRERLVLQNAQVVVALDHDVLGPGPLQTFHARGWSARRRAFQAGDGSAQLYAAEPSPTITGVTATERLPIREDRIAALLQALANRLGVAASAPPLTSRERGWVDRAASALSAYPGHGLVTAGSHHGAEVHALAASIDARLGNLGATRKALPRPAGPQSESYAALLAAMASDQVETLYILDTNPAYASPAAPAFRRSLQRVDTVLHAGLHVDETAKLSHWHAPLAHELESWRDGEAPDGSILAGQPLVRPWLPVRSRIALLAQLLGDERSEREILRANWPELSGTEAWQNVLLGEPIRAAPPAESLPDSSSMTPGQAEAGLAATGRSASDDALVLSIRPDPTIWDGRFASNPWLQELPKPLTKIAWQNAVHVSPALARERGLENGDLVRLSVGATAVEGPIWIMPGQERRTVLVHLGYGRRAGGRIAEGAGFDAWPLAGAAGAVSLTPIGDNERICTTQHHFAMEDDQFVKFVDTLSDKLPPPPPTENFYPPQRSSPAWGMSIDLDLCIGCNACVVACVAENNIPMVGKEQVAMGREMHWIRVDRYYQGSPDDPQHAFQPVPCMHCEDAPCEMGCPVNAAVHSPDGLNLQIYNRCIGTRTCSAYCPYKVRRFNWYDYTGDDAAELKAVRNPDVTVRQRGVMEKCTYCIQRISGARRAAKEENRPIADGEVVTACQAACPTDAIVFGDVADPDTKVSQRKATPRDYDLLHEANTRPRTTYGARIRSGKGKA